MGPKGFVSSYNNSSQLDVCKICCISVNPERISKILNAPDFVHLKQQFIFYDKSPKSVIFYEFCLLLLGRVGYLDLKQFRVWANLKIIYNQILSDHLGLGTS